MNESANVDVLIIACNESINLPHTLPTVTPWAHKVFVIESGSTDNTAEVATSHGADVIQHEWEGYARQRNWALKNLPWESDWILVLDADEAIEKDLQREIISIATKPTKEISESGFWIDRYFIFLGKRIRHCGYSPSWNLRLFKTGHGLYEERDVHEHLILKGHAGKLKGKIRHDDRRGIESYMSKHNKYAVLEAKEILKTKNGNKEHIASDKIGGPMKLRRRLKETIYPLVPARWLFRFLYMYIWRLGILDGLTGLRFCLFISAYELLIELNIKEMTLSNSNE